MKTGKGSGFELRIFICCDAERVTLCSVITSISQWNLGQLVLTGTVQYLNTGMVVGRQLINYPVVGKLAIFSGETRAAAGLTSRAVKELAGYLAKRYSLLEPPRCKILTL